MNLYKETAQKVQELVGFDYLYFDTAIEVKKTPHSHPSRLWGVCVNPAGVLYVMDADQQWHKVEAEQEKALVIPSLYQRIKMVAKDIKSKEVSL